MKAKQKTISKQAKQKVPYQFSLHRYLLFHWQAFQVNFLQKRLSLVSAFMTAAVIGIALALPTVFFVLLQNVHGITQGIEKGTQISLYLHPNETPAFIERLLTQIERRSEVAQVKYISPEEGLKDLQAQGSLTNALEQLSFNPLPPVIEVYPAEHLTQPHQIQSLLETLRAIPGVESAKLDMVWVQRLQAILDFGEHNVMALSLLLGLAVILIIYHTIRLSTQNQQKEINVLMLIGATRAFIRRPFLYMGMLYGCAGALLAWLLVEIFMLWLSFPAAKLAALYHSQFELCGLSFFEGISLIIVGLLLGLVGAWSAVNACVVRYK